LDQIAGAAKMSSGYFHRLFKAATGLTPKEYANGHRAGRIKTVLPKKGTVTEAIYESGFNSNGRFYADSTKILGMKPTEYRNGGTGNTIRFAVGESSLGSILVAASQKGVCSIFLGDDPDLLVRNLQNQFPKADIIGGDAEFEKLVAQVVGFVESPAVGLKLPLDIRGTAFQQRVWKELQRIPVGETVSYSEVANRIKLPKSVRAVAQACGANTLAVAIPCHRVVRTDGDISGYRWGVARKKKLLALEKHNA
jgi:AraC family transcriptional regulator of adaptative response/methylated-DNA-[protein]-cysteine methyltransferase